MKNNKINFFESPKPIPFNFNNLQDGKYHHSEENQIYEQRLFTPVRLTTNIATSPVPTIQPYLSCSNRRSKRKNSQDLFFDQSHQFQNQQQIQQSFHGIQQKLEYSQQEELLIPITPLKNKKMEQEEELQTVRKRTTILTTPVTESKTYQRGLKKLASQAYRFVSHQKRTTYKQVAKKLIQQLGDDGDIDINKKGEMNIKRRVYDALNVLIALGLLKRNGNKIFCKRIQVEEMSGDKSLERERQKKRQQSMQEELRSLAQMYQRRIEIVAAKQKIQKQIRQKISSFRELQNKNINTLGQQFPQKKIQFPLLMVCVNQQTDRKIFIKQEHKQTREMLQQQNQKANFNMWQQGNGNNLMCSFDKTKKIELMGQLDFLNIWKLTQKKQKVQRNQRPKRRR